MSTGKVGLDDYLVAGGSLDRLLHAAITLDAFERDQPRDGDEDTYVATEAGLIWNKRTNEGTVPVQLAKKDRGFGP